MYPHVFEINLDQESNRFIAGQIVTGRVVIVLGKEKAVKGKLSYLVEHKIIFEIIVAHEFL